MLRLLLVLYSIVAWTLAFVLMAVACILALPFAAVFGFERIQRLGPAQVFGLCIRLTLSRVTVTFAEGYDRNKMSLYVQNHISMLDGHLALGTIPTVFCGVQHAAHLNVPFYGWAMRLGNAIPVERGAAKRASALTAVVKNRVARGISVLVFPEGTRTRTGLPGPYRRGAFFMARDAGLPVVPVAVRGFFEVLPKGTFVITPGHIEVRIGAQIETEGLSDEQVARLAEQIRQQTADWVEHRPITEVAAFPAAAAP